MKLLLDSNVIISGLIFNGNEFEVILLGEKPDVVLVISEHIYEECKRAIKGKFPKFIAEFEELLTCSNMKIVPKEDYLHNINDVQKVRDVRDRHVIALAESEDCDIIVTGDKDLLTLGKYKKTKILDPKECLKTLRHGQKV